MFSQCSRLGLNKRVFESVFLLKHHQHFQPLNPSVICPLQPAFPRHFYRCDVNVGFSPTSNILRSLVVRQNCSGGINLIAAGEPELHSSNVSCFGLIILCFCLCSSKTPSTYIYVHSVQVLFSFL